MNYENASFMGSVLNEGIEDFYRRLEENPEGMDTEILSKFDENQLEYINGLQDHPSWTKLDIDDKLELVKDHVSKFFNNTSMGRYFRAHWEPIALCLIKYMH